MKSDAIDIVYLWCDGAEPEFRRQKEELERNGRYCYKEDNMGDVRYVENEELRYSLRSICMNAPWFNHIYIVTNKQIPKWIKLTSKLSIVDHEEIIPESVLPTFNSNVIETYIHKIPGLSEKFIYFNDDMFVNRPITPDFFFNGDRPVLRMKRGDDLFFPTVEEGDRLLTGDKIDDFRKTLLRSWLVVVKKNKKVPWVIRSHCPDPYTKSICNYCEKKYPEIQEINVTPFRIGKDVQWQLVVNLEMISGMGMPYKLREKQINFWVRHFNKFLLRTVDEYEGTECDKTRNRIKNLNPMMFCLNSDVHMNKENRRKSRLFLEDLFKKPSVFEL